ncbi:hypothetical protein EUC01_00920 [Salmonella enterica subsp. enterica serovar Newport]|nr:hypothetical protein [Salmonella enterica subsp. enterica serovar Newport]
MRHKYGALLPDGGVSTLSGLQNCAIHRPDKRSAIRHYTLDYILLIYFNISTLVGKILRRVAKYFVQKPSRNSGNNTH